MSHVLTRAGPLRLLIAALLFVSCAASSAPARASSPPGQWYFDPVAQPARRGTTALVTIHGVPNTACTAIFLWPGAPSGGQRVPPATTDATGVAVFRWTVDPATPPGSWRIDATCAGQLFSTHVPIE